MKRREFLKLSVAGGALVVSPAGLIGCAFQWDGGLTHQLISRPRFFDDRGDSFEIDSVGHGVFFPNAKGRAETRVGGEAGGASQDVGQLNFPVSLAIDSARRVHVVEYGNWRVQTFTDDGKRVGLLAAPGHGRAEVAGPRDIAVSPGGELYVCDTLNHRIQRFAGDGTYLGSFGEQEQLNGPRSLAFSPEGDLHVCESGKSRVVVYDRRGRQRRSYAEGVMSRCIRFDGEGQAWLADAVGAEIVVFGSDGLRRATVRSTNDAGLPVIPRWLGADSDGAMHVAVG